MIYLDPNGLLVADQRYSIVGKCNRNTVETGTYIPFFRIKDISDVFVLPNQLCSIYITHVVGYTFDGEEIVQETPVFVDILEYIVNILRAYEVWWMITEEIDSPEQNMWDEDSDLDLGAYND